LAKADKAIEEFTKRLDALSVEANKAKKEIDSVVDTLKRDRVIIENQKVQLEDIISRANDLLRKLQALIGDI
jgi:ABC-type transporter Mla subunit MlaD